MKSPHTEIADKILKTIATQRETVRKIVSAKDKINTIATVFNAGVRRFEEMGCGVYRWTGESSVLFAASLSSVPSFKDPALADLFESLMAEGVEFTSNEYPANLNRDFNGVVRAENGLEIRVCICVYVKNDSDVCRRVVKSSKTVEQFEYEIVCD